jgi:DNA-binding NarL/FixJ family response regulator
MPWYSEDGEKVVLVTKVKYEGQGRREMSGRYQAEHGSRSRLLLAYADAAYASECGRYFRRMGWEVQMVASGTEARELARAYRPHVVVLDAELLDESGWLTSAKISTENPALRILLVADERTDHTHDRLRMVGATQSVSRGDGAEALALAVLGKACLSEAV